MTSSQQRRCTETERPHAMPCFPFLTAHMLCLPCGACACRAQEEALRPFVAVLRQCDDPVVREAVVARVVQLAVAHGRSLGSGWRTLLEVLRRAAGDSHPQVCSQAVEGLAVAVEALYMGPAPAGHEYLRETVRAAVVAAHNQLASEDVSMEAVQLVQACAARLAEYREQHGQLPAAQPQASHRSLSAALQPMQSQEHPEAAGPGAKQVSGGGGTGPSPHASQGGGVHSGGGAAEASQRCALPTINSIGETSSVSCCLFPLAPSCACVRDARHWVCMHAFPPTPHQSGVPKPTDMLTQLPTPVSQILQHSLRTAGLCC